MLQGQLSCWALGSAAVAAAASDARKVTGAVGCQIPLDSGENQGLEASKGHATAAAIMQMRRISDKQLDLSELPFSYQT